MYLVELAVVAEEDPQQLGDGEDHLAVGDVFEELLLGPVGPQKLPLLMAAGAEAPKLADRDQSAGAEERGLSPSRTMIAVAAQEREIARSHVGHRLGSRLIRRSSAASTEGPAPYGIARGTMKGWPSISS